MVLANLLECRDAQLSILFADVLSSLDACQSSNLNSHNAKMSNYEPFLFPVWFGSNFQKHA